MKRRILEIVLSALTILVLLGSNVHPALAQGFTDLSVRIVANKEKVKPGQTITFTVTATNRGSVDAPLVDVIHKLPAQLQFVSLTCDRGISSDGGFCEYGSLKAGASVVSILVATPLTGQRVNHAIKVTTTAVVSLETTETTDPNQHNNMAKVTTELVAVKHRH
jgi:uncharacterized repeat protein (TIGR01451 family)